jgi:hypothetical protein
MKGYNQSIFQLCVSVSPWFSLVGNLFDQSEPVEEGLLDEVHRLLLGLGLGLLGGCAG